MHALAPWVNRALSCSLVEPPKPGERADPITRLLARRVVELRKSVGINQADLGARMAELRPGWSRSTVAKLERNLRETLSVGDLLALAVVLGVPPIWLLADPATGDPVPVARGIEVDPWSALMWLRGGQQLTDEPFSDEPLNLAAPGRWNEAALPLAWAAQAAAIVKQMVSTAEIRALRFLDPEGAEVPLVEVRTSLDGVDADAADRRLLAQLVPLLQRLHQHGFTLPRLSRCVVERARELEIELPGQEG